MSVVFLNRVEQAPPVRRRFFEAGRASPTRTTAVFFEIVEQAPPLRQRISHVGCSFALKLPVPFNLRRDLCKGGHPEVLAAYVDPEAGGKVGG